jgi:hypothetical protein
LTSEQLFEAELVAWISDPQSRIKLTFRELIAWFEVRLIRRVSFGRHEGLDARLQATYQWKPLMGGKARSEDEEPPDASRVSRDDYLRLTRVRPLATRSTFTTAYRRPRLPMKATAPSQRL